MNILPVVWTPALGETLTISEGTHGGTDVYYVNATDTDTGLSITYNLDSIDPYWALDTFSVDAVTGKAASVSPVWLQ